MNEENGPKSKTFDERATPAKPIRLTTRVDPTTLKRDDRMALIAIRRQLLTGAPSTDRMACAASSDLDRLISDRLADARRRAEQRGQPVSFEVTITPKPVPVRE